MLRGVPTLASAAAPRLVAAASLAAASVGAASNQVALVVFAVLVTITGVAVSRQAIASNGWPRRRLPSEKPIGVVKIVFLRHKNGD